MSAVTESIPLISDAGDVNAKGAEHNHEDPLLPLQLNNLIANFS